MSYLPSLPSCGAIKNFFTDTYAAARDGAKEYGGRTIAIIKKQSSEHPLMVLCAVNAAFGYTVKKIMSLTFAVFGLALSKKASQRLAFAVTVIGGAAANAALMKALEVSYASIPAYLAIGAGFGVGFATQYLLESRSSVIAAEKP